MKPLRNKEAEAERGVDQTGMSFGEDDGGTGQPCTDIYMTVTGGRIKRDFCITLGSNVDQRRRACAP